MTTAEALKHIQQLASDAHLLPETQRLLVLDGIIEVCWKASVDLARNDTLPFQPPARSLN